MKTSRFRSAFRELAPCLGVTLVLATCAAAGSRHFGYSYETTTMTQGSLELETGVTWTTGAENNGSFDIRHELEYGYSDRLQLALYFFDWSYDRPAGQSAKARFEDVAVEVIYNLTDPNAAPFGSALYGEIKGSGDFLQLEGKLLLQKNLGQWLFVYNIGGEIVWQEPDQPDAAELMESAGISYAISPSWSVGAELLHELAVPDVDTFGGSGVYLGPNIMWRNHRVTLTLAALAGEPDFQLRTLLSVDF